MSLLSELTGQLGKIKFIFYADADKPGIGIPYSPAYNPTSFSVSYNTSFDTGKKPVVDSVVTKFEAKGPRTLTMELFYDGTGASPSSGDLGLSSVNLVDVQVRTFLNLAAEVDSKEHQPRYIMVVWGTFIMTGVLTSASVNYLMFAPSGRPLRAKMNITIQESISDTLIGKILQLASPDLSKSIIVKEGDTLPLLCAQEYNDPSLYVKVAEVNNLKNYRKLKQGMELLFPPIDNLA